MAQKNPKFPINEPVEKGWNNSFGYPSPSTRHHAPCLVQLVLIVVASDPSGNWDHPSARNTSLQSPFSPAKSLLKGNCIGGLHLREVFPSRSSLGMSTQQAGLRSVLKASRRD